MGDLITMDGMVFSEPRNTPTIHADGVVRWKIMGTVIQIIFYADELGAEADLEHNISGRLNIKINPAKNAALLIIKDVMEALNTPPA